MPSLPKTDDEPITHQLQPSFFDEFLAGPITGKSMAALRASVSSQRRALLMAVLDMSASPAAPPGFSAEALKSWEILVAVADQAPEIAEGVLMHPPTGVWLVRALRTLSGISAEHDELHYLHSIVAAAAIRAGLVCTIAVPIAHDVVCLPTVGHVRLPPGTTSRLAQLRISAQSALLYPGKESEPIRFSHRSDSQDFTRTLTHRASARGKDLNVEIDHVNPYREFSAPQQPHPMSPAESTHWRRLLDEAWDVLTHRYPAYATELSGGLLTVAPIFSGRNVVGSSSNDAFGGIAFSERVSATALAEVLVHELQHSKLNALLELVELRHDDDGKWWYAPWRDDPRPLIGVLHGIYAFVSVVEFWRCQRDHTNSEHEKREADYFFAHRRHQVRQAVNALLAAPDLTEFGRRLVAAASDRLAACEGDAVADSLAETVVQIEQDHRVTWRLRHVKPDNEHVARIAGAWLDRRPAPSPEPAAIEPFYRPVTRAATRIELLTAKATDPDRYANLRRESHSADVAFAMGDVAAAAAYVDQIRRVPQDIGAWAGLAVSLPPHTPEGHVLLTMPEIVMAVRDRLLELDGSAPDPVELANWLGAN